MGKTHDIDFLLCSTTKYDNVDHDDEPQLQKLMLSTGAYREEDRGRAKRGGKGGVWEVAGAVGRSKKEEEGGDEDGYMVNVVDLLLSFMR